MLHASWFRRGPALASVIAGTAQLFLHQPCFAATPDALGATPDALGASAAAAGPADTPPMVLTPGASIGLLIEGDPTSRLRIALVAAFAPDVFVVEEKALRKALGPLSLKDWNDAPSRARMLERMQAALAKLEIDALYLARVERGRAGPANAAGSGPSSPGGWLARGWLLQRTDPESAVHALTHETQWRTNIQATAGALARSLREEIASERSRIEAAQAADRQRIAEEEQAEQARLHLDNQRAERAARAEQNQLRDHNVLEVSLGGGSMSRWFRWQGATTNTLRDYRLPGTPTLELDARFYPVELADRFSSKEGPQRSGQRRGLGLRANFRQAIGLRSETEPSHVGVSTSAHEILAGLSYRLSWRLPSAESSLALEPALWVGLQRFRFGAEQKGQALASEGPASEGPALNDVTLHAELSLAHTLHRFRWGAAIAPVALLRTDGMASRLRGAAGFEGGGWAFQPRLWLGARLPHQLELQLRASTCIPWLTSILALVTVMPPLEVPINS